MRHVRVAGFALALVLAATSCGGDGDEPATGQARESIEVGYSFGFDAGDVADRIAFRRLEEQGGPRAKLVDMGGVANAVTALVRDDVDIAVVPYPGAVEAAASGAGIRIVLGANMAAEFLLVARPEIGGPADLRGRTVVHSGPGSATKALAEAVVRQAGLGAGDVRFRVIKDSPAKTVALVAGRADAATIDVVDYERVKARHPDLHVIGRLSEIQPRAAVMVWAVSRNAVEERPEQIQTIVDGLLDGYAFVYTDAGRAAWLEEAQRTALEGDTAGLARKTYDFYRRAGFWARRGEPVTPAQHERVVRFWLTEGLVEKGAAYSDVWEPRFWAVPD